jgi:metal-responsive CopG/Arc/MetJ family transcriptional regulator
MRQTVAISLPEELTAELDAAAREEGTSRSELVRDALRRFLAVRRFRAVRDSVTAHAEAAGFITDEDVFTALS